MAVLESITESTTTGSTTLTADYPATVNSGDLLVVFTYQAADTTHTTPTDWTLLRFTAPGFAGVLSSYYKVADGTETGSLSITSGSNFRATHQMFRFSSASGIDTSAENNSTFATSHASAAVTTAADNEIVVVVLGVDAPDDPLTVTVPSGTTLGDVTNNSTVAAMASAYFTQATAGSTGTQTWTSLADGDQSMSQTVAITNAAASAPTFDNAFIGTNGDWLRLSASEALSLGAGGSTGIILTASGGDVTSSYCASFSTTTELVYPTSRRIGKNEVVTYGYTNPGDGWESTAGDDVANVTAGASVTNNSTTMAHSNLIGLYLTRRRNDPKIRM